MRPNNQDDAASRARMITFEVIESGGRSANETEFADVLIGIDDDSFVIEQRDLALWCTNPEIAQRLNRGEICNGELEVSPWSHSVKSGLDRVTVRYAMEIAEQALEYHRIWTRSGYLPTPKIQELLAQSRPEAEALVVLQERARDCVAKQEGALLLATPSGRVRKGSTRLPYELKKQIITAHSRATRAYVEHREHVDSVARRAAFFAEAWMLGETERASALARELILGWLLSLPSRDGAERRLTISLAKKHKIQAALFTPDQALLTTKKLHAAQSAAGKKLREDPKQKREKERTLAYMDRLGSQGFKPTRAARTASEHGYGKHWRTNYRWYQEATSDQV